MGIAGSEAVIKCADKILVRLGNGGGSCEQSAHRDNYLVRKLYIYNIYYIDIYIIAVNAVNEMDFIYKREEVEGGGGMKPYVLAEQALVDAQLVAGPKASILD